MGWDGSPGGPRYRAPTVLKSLGQVSFRSNNSGSIFLSVLYKYIADFPKDWRIRGLLPLSEIASKLNNQLVFFHICYAFATS